MVLLWLIGCRFVFLAVTATGVVRLCARGVGEFVAVCRRLRRGLRVRPGTTRSAVTGSVRASHGCRFPCAPAPMTGAVPIRGPLRAFLKASGSPWLFRAGPLNGGSRHALGAFSAAGSLAVGSSVCRAEALGARGGVMMMYVCMYV